MRGRNGGRDAGIRCRVDADVPDRGHEAHGKAAIVCSAQILRDRVSFPDRSFNTPERQKGLGDLTLVLGIPSLLLCFMRQIPRSSTGGRI
jgi:hypothetical protein